MKIYTFLAISLLMSMAVGVPLTCRGGGGTGLGEVEEMKGNAFHTRGRDKEKVSNGLDLKVGDSIRTLNGTAIIEFDDDSLLEIQPQSHVKFTQYDSQKKEVYVNKGRIWMKASEDSVGQWKIMSPYASSKPQATRVYFFAMPRFSGVCHCDGESEVVNRRSDYKQTHKKDDLVLMADKVTVSFDMDDIVAAGLSRSVHDHSHSLIDDSPLGEKERLTEAQRAKFRTMFESRFAPAGKGQKP